MMSVHRLCLPFAAALLLVSCGPSADESFAKAQAAFAVQDFDSVRIHLTEGLRARPKDIRMLALLVQSQLREGDSDSAAATIRRLRGAGAKGPAVARFEAEANLIAGNPEVALAQLGDDATADAWRLRARAQIALGKPDAAIAAFERGAAAGNDVRQMADYVWFYASANDLPMAERLLKRLQGFAPEAMETLILTGDVAIRRGRADEALAAYQRAARLFPARYQPHVSQAELYEQMGKLEDASRAVAEAGAVEPGHPVIAALYLRLAAKSGRWGEVRNILQAREGLLDPQSAEGQLYAEALLRLGQPEQARALLGRALTMQPGNRHVRRLQGEALLEGGDADEAFRTLQPLTVGMLVEPDELALAEKAARAAGLPEAGALKARLDSPAFHKISQGAVIAEMAMRRGDWSKAVDAYRGLLPFGDDPVVLANMAFALCRAGKPAEAVPLADRAVVLAPEDAVILKIAATARLNAGVDKAAAAALARRAQAQMPGDAEAAVLLRRAGG